MMTQSLNHKPVCRTAPTRPGLLIIHKRYVVESFKVINYKQ